MKHMVDLFSGLGGASEAMIQDDTWNVLRIENNPLLSGVQGTCITCVKRVRDNVESNWIVPKIDLIWASPPCREFSSGYSSPKSKALREGISLQEYKPDLSLVEAAFDIIERVKPKFWLIENVVGAIRYFEPLLGPPRQIIGPYVLWGNFPILDINPEMIISKSAKDSNSRDPLRSNKKAKVDFAISKALKEAVENQKTMFEFM